VRINPRALQTSREANGHSQSSLARESGVSQQRISQLEQDADGHTVTPPLAKKLADALGVPLADIIAASNTEVAA
jgi:transcriptional regulator with XRE-family HTH domain